MKSLKKYKKIILILMAVALITLWCVSCMESAYYFPTSKTQDIALVLDMENKTQKDYEFLFSQTGLSKSGIDSLIAIGEKSEIYEFQKQYFAPCEYESKFMFFPIVLTESKTNGRVKIAPLERGDILVSLTTHTLGFRHGHAGLVLDGETGKTLEHMVLGELSDYSNVSTWDTYPTLAVLRHKDKEVARKAADYAEDKLVGIVYNPLAGLIKKDKSKERQISSSHCSHLVWQAFKAVGADIDGDGGRIVLPKDLLKCPDFEIVQIYGIKNIF